MAPTHVPTVLPTPLPSYGCDESNDKYLYKLIMTDTGGDGWGDVAYTITTNGTTRFTGTLEDGYSGTRYFCIEDNVHTIVLNGSKAEHSDICFEFDDTHGEAFRGCAPIVDLFYTNQGEIHGAPSPAPSPMPSATSQPSPLPTTPSPSSVPTPHPSIDCPEDEHTYKLILSDSGGDGWGVGVEYRVTTNETLIHNGTLASGSYGKRRASFYFYI